MYWYVLRTHGLNLGRWVRSDLFFTDFFRRQRINNLKCLEYKRIWLEVVILFSAATALTLTFLVRNYDEDNPASKPELSRAKAWEKAFVQFMTNYTSAGEWNFIPPAIHKFLQKMTYIKIQMLNNMLPTILLCTLICRWWEAGLDGCCLQLWEVHWRWAWPNFQGRHFDHRPLVRFHASLHHHHPGWV